MSRDPIDTPVVTAVRTADGSTLHQILSSSR